MPVVVVYKYYGGLKENGPKRVWNYWKVGMVGVSVALLEEVYQCGDGL